ncbi:MAG TPA: hypothetical protein VHJ20_18270 [Polyangia bacterium]|nr:hypothetical protein [Polyangia bacterium]
MRDDPAAAWLSPLGRMLARASAWWAWVAYGLALGFIWFGTEYVIETLLHTSGRRLPTIAMLAAAGTLWVPVRRGIIAIKARAVMSRALAAAKAAAASVDNLDAFPAEPDGRLISLVGWVSADGFLPRPVAGEDAVGLALRVQDTYPYLFETMLNFDLVDERGEAVLIATGGGRLFGRATVQLDRANEADRALVTSLDVPASAVPTDWNAFVLREGDPVMVIGTKATLQDLTEAQRNRPTLRPALASAPGRPLLIVRLEAERLEA